VTHIDELSGTIAVTDKDGSWPVHLINANLINIYNTLAATALLREFGLSYQAISESLKQTAIIESRFTEVTAGGVKIVTLLAKELNPIACSRASRRSSVISCAARTSPRDTAARSSRSSCRTPG